MELGAAVPIDADRDDPDATTTSIATSTTSDASGTSVSSSSTTPGSPAVISGTFAGAATEANIGDAPVTATGTIAISDVDPGDNPTFADITSAGDSGFGTFALVNGVWTYTLDQTVIQDLDAGDVVNDTVTFTASDGSTQLISIAITGTDDAPIISGSFTNLFQKAIWEM